MQAGTRKKKTTQRRNAYLIRGTQMKRDVPTWAVSVGAHTAAEAATHATLTHTWAPKAGEARRADGEGSSEAKLKPITVRRLAAVVGTLRARKDTTGAGVAR